MGQSLYLRVSPLGVTSPFNSLKNKTSFLLKHFPCKYFRKAAEAGIRLQLQLFE